MKDVTLKMRHLLLQTALKEQHFLKLFLKGKKEFSAIAIVGGKNGAKEDEAEYCAPCGVCRQVMMEFCDPKTFKVYLAKTEDDYIEYTLEEILPLGFSGKNLD